MTDFFLLFVQEKLHVIDRVPLFYCDCRRLFDHDGLDVDAAGGVGLFVLGLVFTLSLGGEHRGPVAAGEFSAFKHGTFSLEKYSPFFKEIHILLFFIISNH